MPLHWPFKFPNFSNLPASHPASAQINVQGAGARGFTDGGAERMYLEGQLPKGAPDLILLSRFADEREKMMAAISCELPDLTKLINRGQNLDALVKRAEELEATSETFKVAALNLPE